MLGIHPRRVYCSDGISTVTIKGKLTSMCTVGTVCSTVRYGRNGLTDTSVEMNEINALNDKVQKVTKALEAIQTKVAAQEVEVRN